MAKIAVPVENGQVFQHFGRSVRFLVCEVNDGTVTSSETVDVDTPGSGGAVAAFLGRIGVNIVICTGMGEGARGHLYEQGIEIVAGASGDAEAAVGAYLAGTLVNDPTRIHGEGRCGCKH